jgi:predicted dinucleotide-utilizing enzyme
VKQSILVVGCGNMGSALTRGLCLDKWHNKYDFCLYDKVLPKAIQIANELGLSYVADLNEVKSEPYLIFLAVKPNQVKLVCQDLTQFKNSILISLLSNFFQYCFGVTSTTNRSININAIRIGNQILNNLNNHNRLMIVKHLKSPYP